MNSFKKMLNFRCPNGVEYKNIKDICLENFWVMPSTPQYIDKGVPYITSKNIKNGKVIFNDIKYISENDYNSISSNRPIKEGDILISMIGTIGEVGIVSKDDLNFYGQNMYLLRLNQKIISIKYFYYYFTSNLVREKLIGESSNGNQGYLKTKNIESIKVPVPPIEIQYEIVEILDKFELLQSKISEELKLRKEQFNYYNYKLFFKNNYETVSLNDIVKIEKGKTPIQKAIPGDYPLVVTTTDRKSCLHYQFDDSVVCIPLVSSRGHGIASLNHVYFQEGKFALGNILCALISKDKNLLNPKYLFYYFENTKDYTLVPLMKGGANVSLHIDDIEKIKIPLPPLTIQNKIVDKLEYFDKMIINLSTELELRKKQFKYYVREYLDFEEMVVND